MERNTKRIIAIIAVLAVAGTGIGVGVWYVLQPEANPYEYPGLTGQKPLDQTIKIGVLDGMEFTGAYSWGGAYVAAEAINEGGGVEIGGKTYWVGLVREDTKESLYEYDTATAATIRMIEHKPHAILGGFRSEVFSTYIDRVMTAKIPFMITGAATTEFCQEWVRDAYPFYKYLFRDMPINSDHLGEHLGHLLPNYIIPEIEDHQGKPVDSVRIVHEEIMWTTRIKDELIVILNSTVGAENITTSLIGTDWTATEFQGLWGNIKSSGNQLVVPIISDATHGIMFGSFYNALKPNCTVAGINVVAQIEQLYWPYTAGACVYEVTTHGIAYVNFTERTHPFYDRFVELFGPTIGSPLYCSIGGADAVNLFVEAIVNGESFAALDIVAELEKFNATNPFDKAMSAPNFGFDQYHDVLETIPGVRDDFFGTVYRQYHPNGSLQLIPSAGLYPWEDLYPRNQTAELIFPDWWLPA